VNAYTLALADKDARLSAMLGEAAVNFPDGKSVVWANRLLHRRRALPGERVYGPDLFLDVFALGSDAGLRHYLLGSTPHVLARLEAALRTRFPRALIAGAESPPFRPPTAAERESQRARIAASEVVPALVELEVAVPRSAPALR